MTGYYFHKIETSNWLRGSIRYDFDLAQRGLWADLIALAAACPLRDGKLRFGEGRPMKRDWIAATLMIDRTYLDSFILLCQQDQNTGDDRHRIEIMPDETIDIVNFPKYQDPPKGKGKSDSRTKELRDRGLTRLNATRYPEEALDAMGMAMCVDCRKPYLGNHCPYCGVVKESLPPTPNPSPALKIEASAPMVDPLPESPAAGIEVYDGPMGTAATMFVVRAAAAQVAQVAQVVKPPPATWDTLDMAPFRAKFPGLDLTWELGLCREWWDKCTGKKLKSPVLAFGNWCRKAQADQRNGKNGHGVHPDAALVGAISSLSQEEQKELAKQRYGSGLRERSPARTA